MSSERKTGAIVVSGPYGAGKSTLLQELHTGFEGTKLFVVNDVGETNIDAARLSGVGEVRGLASGCIACSNLDQFLQIAQEASEAGVDWLVIEPTGGVDGKELKQALKQTDLPHSSVVLVNVRDFELDLADGLVKSQVPIADVVALTHLGDIESYDDERLNPVMDFVRDHAPWAPIVLVPDKSQTTVDEEVYRRIVHNLVDSQNKGRLNLESSSQVDVTVNELLRSLDEHTEGDRGHHEHTHSHGTYALSLPLKPETNFLQIHEALVGGSDKKILRAKGVCLDEEGLLREFDVVRGVLRLGGPSNRPPHMVVIDTTAPAPSQFSDIMAEHREDGRTKMQNIKAPADPDKTVESIKRWMERFPPVVRQDGKLQVRSDSFVLLTLALRNNVPEEVRKEAVWHYTKWLIDSAKMIPEVEEKFNRQEVGGWQFLLGKHMSRILVEELHNLNDSQQEELIKIGPLRLILEGLEKQTKDAKKDPTLFIDIEQWALPGKNGQQLIEGCLQHSDVDRTEVHRVLSQTLGLLRETCDKPEYIAKWQEMVDHFRQ